MSRSARRRDAVQSRSTRVSRTRIASMTAAQKKAHQLPHQTTRKMANIVTAAIVNSLVILM